MKARIGAIAGIATALACASDVGVEAPSVGGNSCRSSGDCAKYVQTPEARCSGGICVTRAASNEENLIYTISVPSSVTSAPGVTYIGSSRLDLSCLESAQPSCLFASRSLRRLGAYTVPYKVASELGIYLGEKPSADGPSSFSIPVRVEYRAFVTAPGGGANNCIDRDTRPPPASGLGYPVPALLARSVLFRRTEIRGISPEFERALPDAPGPGNPVGWDDLIPPGNYDVALFPEPPFDALFPPIVRCGSFGDGIFELNPDTADRTFTIGTSTDDFSGWSVAIHDVPSGRRISVKKTLVRGANQVTLYTSARGVTPDFPYGLRDTELRLAPPDGVDQPTRIVESSDNRIPTPTVISYPKLFAPVAIGGSVLTPEGEGVRARIELLAARYSGLDSDQPSTVLAYSKVIETDESGRYEASVFPGVYFAYVVPEENLALAPFNGELTVSKTPERQDGKSFTLLASPTVSGRILIGDGRALENCEVEARFSAIPRSTDTSNRGGLFKIYRPRFSTRTRADGSFDLPVEEGVFDFTVKPRPESHLPWLVIPMRTVRRSGLDLGELRVRAPILQKTFVSNNENAPVRGALVRVFDVSRGANLPIEVGSGTADRSGIVELLLGEVRP